MCFISMYSVLNTLSEWTNFYISKNITSYTFLLVFKIVKSFQSNLKSRKNLITIILSEIVARFMRQQIWKYCYVDSAWFFIAKNISETSRITGNPTRLTHLGWNKQLHQRNSYQKSFVKKSVLKNFAISQKTLLLKSLFNEAAGLKACKFIKKKLQYRLFPVKFEKSLRTPILKNICELLLLTPHETWSFRTKNSLVNMRKIDSYVNLLTNAREIFKAKTFSCTQLTFNKTSININTIQRSEAFQHLIVVSRDSFVQPWNSFVFFVAESTPATQM